MSKDSLISNLDLISSVYFILFIVGIIAAIALLSTGWQQAVGMGVVAFTMWAQYIITAAIQAVVKNCVKNQE